MIIRTIKNLVLILASVSFAAIAQAHGRACTRVATRGCSRAVAQCARSEAGTGTLRGRWTRRAMLCVLVTSLRPEARLLHIEQRGLQLGVYRAAQRRLLAA